MTFVFVQKLLSKIHCYDGTSTYSTVFNLSNDCPVIDYPETEDRMLAKMFTLKEQVLVTNSVHFVL